MVEFWILTEYFDDRIICSKQYRSKGAVTTYVKNSTRPEELHIMLVDHGNPYFRGTIRGDKWLKGLRFPLPKEVLLSTFN